MNKEIVKIYNLINDDAWASEFQNMGKYRSALLKEIRILIGISKPPDDSDDEEKKKTTFLL